MAIITTREESRPLSILQHSAYSLDGMRKLLFTNLKSSYTRVSLSRIDWMEIPPPGERRRPSRMQSILSYRSRKMNEPQVLWRCPSIFSCVVLLHNRPSRETGVSYFLPTYKVRRHGNQDQSLCGSDTLHRYQVKGTQYQIRTNQ